MYCEVNQTAKQRVLFKDCHDSLAASRLPAGQTDRSVVVYYTLSRIHTKQQLYVDETLNKQIIHCTNMES